MSKYAYIVCIAILTYTNLVFYPKWKKSETEAAISWDVCGYYYYLPAIFIYKDLKKVAFHTELDKKYQYQGNDFYSALPASSGNLVMKYTSGMAILYAPAFFIAHALAKSLGFEPDGFSPIYQFAISFWSVLWAFVGLWYLRKLLLKLNFTEGVTSTVLLLYVIATNYLEYAGISSPQTHSYIFTLYALMLFTTICFYEAPSLKKAISIGLCLGFATLTRPTEIITIVLPIFWGVFDKTSLLQRFHFINKHFSKYALASTLVFSIGAIQLIYFKYVSNHFLYNSYGNNVWMDWLKPHILDGLFSARRGWLIYTPIMLFSVLGFVPLYTTYRAYFWSIFLFLIVFIYIAFGYNIWWYGGSLGQRQMVQIYPILAIPFAAFLTQVAKTPTRKILFSVAASVCIYLNFWLIWQAHNPNGLWRDETTPAYLRRTIGRWDVPIDAQKLLDNKYDFTGDLKDVETIYDNNFETDTTQNIEKQNIINGKRSIFVDEARPMTIQYNLDPLSIKSKKYLRATATFRSTIREGTPWQMPTFIVDFQKNGASVKYFEIRPHRLLDKDNEQKTLTLDMKIPTQPYNKIVFWLQNAGSSRKMIIDDVKVEAFN
ncbi:MAG: hypothetical protein U5L45_21700 [Saprospiraceae bacterium]|nr:hypothetical protein [Saprospiraceae bacterium]